MITNADITILNETYKNSKMAVEAINAIIGKVYDDDLSLDLNRQAQKYLKIEQKAGEKLRKEGIAPETGNPLGKAMLWTAIQANTLLNTSTGHVADMMIQGNTKGITEMSRVLKANEQASNENCELASELMDFEEKCIDKLKSYL